MRYKWRLGIWTYHKSNIALQYIGNYNYISCFWRVKTINRISVLFAINIFSACLSEASVCTIPSQAQAWAKVFLFHILAKGKKLCMCHHVASMLEVPPWVLAQLGEVCSVAIWLDCTGLCQEAATRAIRPRESAQGFLCYLPFGKRNPTFYPQWSSFIPSFLQWGKFDIFFFQTSFGRKPDLKKL